MQPEPRHGQCVARTRIAPSSRLFFQPRQTLSGLRLRRLAGEGIARTAHSASCQK